MNETSLTQDRCLNCHAELDGTYCATCGQLAKTGRITFRETFQTFLSAAFLIEGKYMLTLRQLIINPGKLFREYLAGKRASYYKPISFFILNTAIYILVRTLIDFDPLEDKFNNMEGKEVPELMTLAEKSARFMVKNINYILFTLVFAIAIWMKAFYRKRYYLAEYTAVGFYLAGMYILLGIGAMMINKVSDFNTSNWQLYMLVGLIMYSSLSFFRPLSFSSVLKSLGISVLSLVFYMLFSFGISVLLVVLF